MAATGLFAGNAIAQDAAYGNFYVGFGVGKTNLKTSVTFDGTGVDAFKFDDDASSVSGILGYTFNPYLSVEGAFAFTGRAKASETKSGGVNSITMDNESDMRSLEVVAKGTLPLGKFELFARGGVVFADVDSEIKINAYNGTAMTNVPSKITASYQDGGFLLGAGAGYNFGRGQIRLQYDYYGTEVKGTNDQNLTLPNDDNTFTKLTGPVTIETKDTSRLMLSFTGYF